MKCGIEFWKMLVEARFGFVAGKFLEKESRLKIKCKFGNLFSNLLLPKWLFSLKIVIQILQSLVQSILKGFCRRSVAIKSC